jgi:tol-pal system protein YbgF
MMRTIIAFGVAVSLAGLCGPACAATPEKRPPAPAAPAPRETIVDLLLQIQALQDEVRNLRGQVEVQNYELEKLKARQRDLLADLDRRVRDVERRGGTAAAAEPAPAATGPATAPAPPSTAATAPAPVAAPVTTAGGNEQQEYDAAFALMRGGFYDRSTKAFREFLVRHPRSSLAGNAQYWIGEANYVVRNYRVALEEYGKVLQDYATSQKVPDALLKIGYSHYELGEWVKARETLNRVVKQYPNTSVSKSAESRLALMKKEGH